MTAVEAAAAPPPTTLRPYPVEWHCCRLTVRSSATRVGLQGPDAPPTSRPSLDGDRSPAVKVVIEATTLAVAGRGALALSVSTFSDCVPACA